MEQRKIIKIIKKIGAIVGAFALTVVACALPFCSRFKTNLTAKNMIASANETSIQYNYIGSNFLTLAVVRIGVESVFNFKVDINTFDGSSSVKFYLTQYVLGGEDYSLSFRPFYEPSKSVEYLYVFSGLISDQDLLVYPNGDSLDSPTIIRVNRDPDFSGNVQYLSISRAPVSDLFSKYNLDANWLTLISYFDENDKSISFGLPMPVAFAEEFVSRTYYVVDTSSSEYTAGYNNGYNAGNESGYSDGYSAGKNNGYTTGYSAGRLQGMSEANDYTFFSLVSAVIDAPIQAFMGLFNFNLLGINLAGFFTGLLTVAFIITVVRMVL